jgi:hypothetical protein
MKKGSVFWNDKNESLSKLKGLVTTYQHWQAIQLPC